MEIQLMTDGGADIPKRLNDTLDIIVVPLYLHFQNERYISGVTMDIPDFYRKIKESNELPRSAAPSPNDFYEAYKKVDPAIPIVMRSLTKELSSTYENAVNEENMLLEEELDGKIELINKKTASCGLALLLQEANTIINGGYSYEAVVAHLHTCVAQTTT